MIFEIISGGEKTDWVGKEWAGLFFPRGKNWLGGNSGLLHRNLLQSDEQCPGAPLSHLRKIPSATSGSNKGVKIVPKALSGAIAWHSGDGKFYAMPHNEALVGG